MAWKEYFTYNFVNTSLAAGSLASPVFVDTVTRFDTDADFEVMKPFCTPIPILMLLSTSLATILKKSKLSSLAKPSATVN